MKLYTLLFLISSVILTTSCSDDDTPTIDSEPSGHRILPLGASRVQGNTPEYESYRFPLWDMLVDADYEFNFVGTQSDNFSYVNDNNISFDNDHEGYSGYTSSQILELLPNTLNQVGSPDIVLFSSPGANDILERQNYDSVIVNINRIIDVLQEDNPNVVIIIEQLAPGSSFITNLAGNLFNQIHEDIGLIAQNKTNENSQVIAVDMSDGFSQDDYLADIIHYNEEGAEFIASKYFEILTDYL